MYRVASIVAFAAVPINADPADDPAWPTFQAYMEKFGRNYNTASETAGRFEIFKDNLKLIEQRNAKGQEKHGINEFADMTSEEFSQKFLLRRDGTWDAMKPKYASKAPVWEESQATAKSVNWCDSDKGACTPIKNQGQCGSCWAFGATEMVESEYFLQTGTLYELSPQQLTSCDTYCDGCSGGNAVLGWEYINSVGGQVLASEYPYTSGTTQQSGTCAASKVKTKDFKAGVAGAYAVSQNATTESNMLIEIADRPMSVAVDAENLWQTYQSGVISASSGCGTALDHNVQVVGYNKAGNYWIVRNSWGPSWGNAGFIYLEAGSNVCGIAMEATYPETQAPATAMV